MLYYTTGEVEKEAGFDEVLESKKKKPQNQKYLPLADYINWHNCETIRAL